MSSWLGQEPTSGATGRRESPAERDDRNLAELLQELRVAALGVQVLFGFLLSLPFTARFGRLQPGQRGLYVATLLLAALATVLLCAPVAYHRVMFRRHQKRRLVEVANVMVMSGLGAVSLAVAGAVALVVSVVEGGPAGLAVGAVTWVTFVVVWLGLPGIRRASSLRPSVGVGRRG